MTDASYGTVRVGRLTLREAFPLKTDVNAQTGVRTVTITGEESFPPLTSAQLKQRHEDIMTMRDMVMPIAWTNKSDHDGFYLVDDVSAEVINWTGEVLKFAWSIRAVRVGPENAVDIESRITGVARDNDFNLSGERWHAPSIGHYAYYTGTSQPSGSVVRTGEDGAITVYRGVPNDVNPRWGVDTSDYQDGRVRVLLGGIERTGTNLSAAASGWELSNGLLNISPSPSGGLTVESHDGSQYEDKDWNLSVGATATPELGEFDAVTVLRNDFEMCTIRLVKNVSPVGRTTLDLSLRRGSRFVEGYLQSDFSTTLAVWLATAENSSSPVSSGYVVASANDADGNRAIVGTARSFNTDTGNVRLHKTAATSLDFFIGAVIGGGSAVDGDEAADLRDQYIRAMSEYTMCVRR